MQPSDALVKQGIAALPTCGDGRQSGTSASPSILNASPEAAVGGGLALLQTGDRVRVDLNTRRVDVLLPEDELASRRAAYRPPVLAAPDAVAGALPAVRGPALDRRLPGAGDPLPERHRGAGQPPPLALTLTGGLLHDVLTSRVYDVARETPLDRAPAPLAPSGQRVLLKREDLQPVFSFKLRGALQQDRAPHGRAARPRGDLRASAGNHAQGVAFSARAARPAGGDRDAADDARDQGRRSARAGGRGRARRRQLRGGAEPLPRAGPGDGPRLRASLRRSRWSSPDRARSARRSSASPTAASRGVRRGGRRGSHRRGGRLHQGADAPREDHRGGAVRGRRHVPVARRGPTRRAAARGPLRGRGGGARGRRADPSPSRGRPWTRSCA